MMLTGYAIVICLNLFSNCHKVFSFLAETDRKVHSHNLKV